MYLICKNCHHTFEGNFCPNCGQSANTNKINLQFVLFDLQRSILRFDKGILYTTKQLFTRPGHAIREFIEGKRIQHSRPMVTVLVLASIYGLLNHFFQINLSPDPSGEGSTTDELNEFLISHYALVTLLTIPFYTVGTFVCFRKQGYHFMEYFILDTFKTSQRLIFHIAVFPILYYFNEEPQLKFVLAIIFMLDIGLMYWSNATFFDKLTKIRVLLFTILSLLACVLSIIILSQLIIFFYVFYELVLIN